MPSWLAFDRYSKDKQGQAMLQRKQLCGSCVTSAYVTCECPSSTGKLGPKVRLLVAGRGPVFMPGQNRSLVWTARMHPSDKVVKGLQRLWKITLGLLDGDSSNCSCSAIASFNCPSSTKPSRFSFAAEEHAPACRHSECH